MKQFLLIAIIFTLSFYGVSNAQSPITKSGLESILKETLKKSRETASNNWRFDNSNDNYFTKDTIILNTARSYRTNYCEGINWSFYENEKFIIENVQYCNEPPTKLISKKQDSIKLKIEELKNRVCLKLYNVNGVFETFEVLDFKRNEPLSREGDYQFDYSMTLLRLNK